MKSKSNNDQVVRSLALSRVRFHHRANVSGKQSIGQKLLHNRHAPLITHGALAALTGLMFALLLRTPLWVAAVPCALLHYRIGALLHEYIHGIPFRRYSRCLFVLSMFEGILVTFGLLEIFRGIHLAHHRWLNTNRDPGFESLQENLQNSVVARLVWYFRNSLKGEFGPMLYVRGLFQGLRGEHPYIKPRRVAIGIVMSLAAVAVWIAIGHRSMPIMLVLLSLYNALVPSSFRGAVEHSSYKGDPNFANEYRVWIPLFNLNRHIHHHLDSTCPWYLLEFCTLEPLAPICYWTHWVHMFIKRDYVLMQPMREISPPMPTREQGPR